MMVQILQYGMDLIFYFASYLAEEIHTRLIGISKTRVDKPFGWYYLLMYMCLIKGVSIFKKEMKIENQCERKKLLVQLWSVDMS